MRAKIKTDIIDLPNDYSLYLRGCLLWFPRWANKNCNFLNIVSAARFFLTFLLQDKCRCLVLPCNQNKCKRCRRMRVAKHDFRKAKLKMALIATRGEMISNHLIPTEHRYQCGE